MFAAPYNTPAALGRHPLAAVFWAMLAPFFFQFVAIMAAGLVAPGWVEAQLGGGGDVAGQWRVLVLGQFIGFIALSLWCQRIGAGPFGGDMRLPGDWLLAALFVGPVVLIGTGFLVGLFAGNGEGDWMYREDYDTSLLTREALGPMLLVSGLVLAPLIEEVAFRGVALGCLLARGWAPLPAAILTSLAFTSLHVQYTLPALLPIFLVGLYCAWLRIQTGSIAAPIAAHMSANAVSLLLFAAAPAG